MFNRISKLVERWFIRTIDVDDGGFLSPLNPTKINKFFDCFIYE